MAVAIRTITQIQAADDAPSLGAGQDGYALTWDNASGAFVATALVTDHGALAGLSDDDHTQYARLAGRSGGQTLYGGTDANDDITLAGTSHSTVATSYVAVKSTLALENIGASVTDNSPHAIETAVDIANANVTAMYLYPRDTANTRLYFGRAGKAFYALNFAQVVTFESMPSLDFTGSPVKMLSISDLAILSRTATDIRIMENAYWETLSLYAAGSVRATVSSSGVGIGKTVAATPLHVVSNTAITDAVTNVVTIGHNTSGTAAAGFGAGLAFQLESSTTADQAAARVQALWYEATHASYKADLVGTAYDAGGEREGWRVRGAGSAAAIGFLGATPAARQAHVADPSGGATVDAEARTAINSILATLETFGLHATS